MSFVKLGARTGNIARAMSRSSRDTAFSNYTLRDRLALYDVPNLVTPGDIRRAIGDKLKGCVKSVQIDYQGFRPSGKALVILEKAEQLGMAVNVLKPFNVCGNPVRVVPHYGLDQSQREHSSGDREAFERITGNGPSGSYPNVERNVVIWGLPGKTSVDDVTNALQDFKTEQKKGKATVVKLLKPEFQFTLFSRFIITMASVSEARRLVRAWNMTPWNPGSSDLIRAQVLY